MLPVALYGTLRRGEVGHRALRLSGRLRWAGRCRIAGRLLDLGRYPGLLPGRGLVEAELCELWHADDFDLLDRYEGYDSKDLRRSLFIRQRVMLRSPCVEAWVYFYNAKRPGAVPGLPINSGDWKRRRRPAE